MQRKKIVTIGGGTGSYTLLRGLKKYPYDLSAIVTMADDGGSTGVLRDELGALPPGDIRQCLVALSDSTITLRSLMNYRFEHGGLKGHSFGNLLLTALEKITGNFSAGIEEATKILNVRGTVLPVSEGDMRLKITLEDGRVINGEKELDENEDIRRIGIHDVKLSKRVRANRRAIDAITMADIIIIGPGDHFGSIVPNLLLSSVAKAIKKTSARVFFIAPLTNKKGHTSNFDVADYVYALEQYIGRGRINDVFYNTTVPQQSLIARYEKKEGAHSLVQCNEDAYMDRSYKIVKGDLLRRERMTKNNSDAIAHTRAFIRHDGDKLAEAIAYVINHGDTRMIEIV